MIDEGNINEYLLYKLEKLRNNRSGDEINIAFVKTGSDDIVNTFCDNFFHILNKNSGKTIGIRVYIKIK
jgi:hypothetical protein